MAEPFGAAREAPKGLDPGGDELAEADGSHCESVALEHERAQPDGRARVGDELARLEVLLGNGGVVEQRRPLGTSLPRTSHVPRASLPRADCLQPRCSSRFVARSYHPPAKGDDELEAIKRNARCGGPARTPDIVKFALRSKYMRRRTLSVLHTRHRDRVPSRDASGERCRVPEPSMGLKKSPMVNEWSHSQSFTFRQRLMVSQWHGRSRSSTS